MAPPRYKNAIRNNDFVAWVQDELEGEIEGAKISHLAPRYKNATRNNDFAERVLYELEGEIEGTKISYLAPQI